LVSFSLNSMRFVSGMVFLLLLISWLYF